MLRNNRVLAPCPLKALFGLKSEEEGTLGVLSLQVINWESTLHIPAQVELSPEARTSSLSCCAAESTG